MKDKDSQSKSRRNFLKGATVAVSATAIATAVVIQNLDKPTVKEKVEIDLDTYKPEYFSADEWAFIIAATDRLIPADDIGPGALETNVPVFIDKQMLGSFGKASDWYMEPPFIPSKPQMGYQSSLTPAETYRKGIKATEEYCQKTYQKLFSKLSDSEKDTVLSQLESGEIKFSDLSSVQFFTFLLQNTKEGYFADPIHGGNKDLASWKMIGFPGARASFKEWVEYPNVKYPLGPVSVDGTRG